MSDGQAAGIPKAAKNYWNAPTGTTKVARGSLAGWVARLEVLSDVEAGLIALSTSTIE